MKKTLSLFLIGLLCVSFSTAAITTYKNDKLQSNEYYNQGEGIYTLEDSPFVRNRAPKASIELTLESISAPEEGTLVTEILLFHHKIEDKIGKKIDGKHQLCCYTEQFEEGKCDSPGRVILDRQSEELFTESGATNSLWFYYWDADWYSTDNSTGKSQLQNYTMISDEFAIEQSGYWRLWIIQCGINEDEDDGKISISGRVTFQNPYGYLPGEIAPKMPVYYILTILYAFWLLIWGGLSTLYRDSLHKLQKLITIVTLLGLVENLLYAADYTQYNANGTVSVAFNVITFLVSVFKMTFSFICLLLVTMGYTVTRPKLESKQKTLVVILSIVYFVIDFIYQCVAMLRGTPQTQYLDVSAGAELFFLILTVILDFVWLFFIYFYMFRSIRETSTEKHGHKHKMFKRLGYILGFFYIFSFIFFCIELIAMAAGRQDDWWRGWFIFDIYWNILHFLVLLCVSILWRPNNNNQRYAYTGIDNDVNNGIEMPVTGLDEVDDDGSSMHSVPIDSGNVHLEESTTPRGRFTIDDNDSHL